MLSLIAYQLFAVIVLGNVLPEAVLKSDSTPRLSRNVSTDLFNELEELARIVDISYCVGSYGTGIQKPFECASHCSEFKNFELVSVRNFVQLAEQRALLTRYRGGVQVT